MKRKGLSEVYDDFTDMSLSAPGAKIRRLDADFFPIMEEQPMLGSIIGDEISKGGIRNAEPNAGLSWNEYIFPPADNEERALVLYKPVYTQLGKSLKINPELITGPNSGIYHLINGHFSESTFWPGNHRIVEENFGGGSQSSHIDCLAMVPSRSHITAQAVEVSTWRSGMLEEPMEAEAGGSSMEIEDDRYC